MGCTATTGTMMPTKMTPMVGYHASSSVANMVTDYCERNKNKLTSSKKRALRNNRNSERGSNSSESNQLSCETGGNSNTDRDTYLDH